jgi:serine/threonine protein kinase
MPLTIGTRLGPYEIVGPLGTGGMGEVYRARDTKLGREVAIKVLPQGVLDEPDRRARFDREAKILASLNHPHIAAIFGVEDHGTVRALVLELVEGPTLTACVSAGAMPSEEATAIARQIAEALNAAHQRGIVHRDLKPANVKICQRGTVKLLDFGIATQTVSADGDTVTRGASLTATGKVMGTVGYMSPEQIRGDEVDARSDQFALGLILFEMLTGRHPFSRASSAETVAAILRDVAPTAEFGPAVPAPLRRKDDTPRPRIWRETWPRCAIAWRSPRRLPRPD